MQVCRGCFRPSRRSNRAMYQQGGCCKHQVRCRVMHTTWLRRMGQVTAAATRNQCNVMLGSCPGAGSHALSPAPTEHQTCMCTASLVPVELASFELIRRRVLGDSASHRLQSVDFHLACPQSFDFQPTPAQGDSFQSVDFQLSQASSIASPRGTHCNMVAFQVPVVTACDESKSSVKSRSVSDAVPASVTSVVST